MNASANSNNINRSSVEQATKPNNNSSIGLNNADANNLQTQSTQPPPKPTAAVTTTLTTCNNDATTTTSTVTTPATLTPTTAASNTINGSQTNSRASTEGRKTPSVTNADSLSKTNLYIRGLQLSTSDQDLYNMCSRFGVISSTKAILEKTTGYCRGYGFVEFNSPQSAELAVKELTKSGVQAQMAKITPLYSSHPHNANHNHHHLNLHHNHHHNKQHRNNNHHHQHNQNNSSSTSVSGTGHNSGGNHNNNAHNNSGASGGLNTSTTSSNNSSQQTYHNSLNNQNNADPTNLYIANLPPNMTEQELEDLLSTYGPVVSTRILRDPLSNVPRGVGFARMETRDKCEQIIDHLNGIPYKGCSEPLLVKFADGGNKKRIHHHNQHQHHNHHQHHQSNNHHNPQHKIHQDDNRWRDSGNSGDLVGVTSFEHQGNIPHSNHLSDLAMMSTLSYTRIQPGFPPTIAAGTAYHPSLGPPTSAPQWIHPGGPGQPYVIPPQIIQTGSLGQTNQAAPTAPALHYGHISQITSQIQGLQIAHPGGPVGGYLPQWSPLWTHTLPQQPQHSVRLPAPMQPSPSSHQPQQHQAAMHQQPSSPQSNLLQQTSSSQQPQQIQSDHKRQIPMPM